MALSCHAHTALSAVVTASSSYVHPAYSQPAHELHSHSLIERRSVRQIALGSIASVGSVECDFHLTVRVDRRSHIRLVDLSNCVFFY